MRIGVTANDPDQVKGAGSVRRVGRVGDLRGDDENVGSGIHVAVLAMGDAATGKDRNVAVGPAAGIVAYHPGQTPIWSRRSATGRRGRSRVTGPLIRPDLPTLTRPSTKLEDRWCPVWVAGESSPEGGARPTRAKV